MKRLIGILIIAQAIFVGIISYQIQILSDSILQAASYIQTNEGTLGWGGTIPKLSIFLLVLLIVIGLFLTLTKNKNLK